MDLDRAALAIVLSIGYWIGVFVAFVLYIIIMCCYKRRIKSKPFPV